MSRIGFMLIFFIIVATFCSFRLEQVKTYGTIYIRASGAVEPLGAPISSLDKITYSLTGDASQTITVERDNILVEGFGHTIQGDGTGYGFFLNGRRNVTISNMNIRGFDAGVRSEYCLETRIVNNNVTNNHNAGIWLVFSNSSWICRNQLARNLFAGIILDVSSSNYVLENNLSDNGESIKFEYSINGIALSQGNTIFHNNFINGSVDMYFGGSPPNFWDDGYPSGGNFWSDFKEKYPDATEINASGLWNTPYVIDANNTDRYPLLAQYAIPEFSPFFLLSAFIAITSLTIIAYRKKRVDVR